MSTIQTSSTGASLPSPDTSSIFSLSDLEPKPLSHFSVPSWLMYGGYIRRWKERTEEFDSFVESEKEYYELILAFVEDVHHAGLLECLDKRVSDARETLMVDLGKLEDDCEAWCAEFGNEDANGNGN